MKPKRKTVIRYIPGPQGPMGPMGADGIPGEPGEDAAMTPEEWAVIVFVAGVSGLIGAAIALCIFV